MDCRHVTPVDHAAPAADHSHCGVESGSLQDRPCAHAHRLRVRGLERQYQYPRFTRTKPRAATQRVLISINMQVIIDANQQVDRLGRRIVKGYHESLYARPIGRLSCRSYDQLGPVGRFEIGPRRGAAGIDAGSGDPCKAGTRLGDPHRPDRQSG
jgi:hypothetical protein